MKIDEEIQEKAWVQFNAHGWFRRLLFLKKKQKHVYS